MFAISSKKQFVKVVLFCLIFVLNAVCASGNSNKEGESTLLVNEEKKEKVFVIHAPIRDLAEFRKLAEQAARLKPYGKVEINISTLADKGFHDIPEGGSPWHEYASNNPTPYKFFPDPKIAPFIPAEFVKKNRQLLLDKAEILREYGLGAAFWCYEPNFLPEEFFEVYPHMRGPRVDIIPGEVIRRLLLPVSV